jgi:7-cyano-7-deazaguanine synthase in queuosine biosynthesis
LNGSETVRPVHLAWTGGWDSTFRVLSLISQHSCCIQPYYVIDRQRRSWPIEIETMHKIQEACRQDPSTFIGTIRQPIFVEKETIAADELITAQYKQLRNRVYLGVQYDWLARLAKSLSIQSLELGVQGQGHFFSIVRQHIESKQGSLTRTYVIHPDAPQDLQFLRYFEFPIINVSKGEMERIAKERGFYPILEKSWFCFAPLKGLRPCGTCNPCKYAIEGGMARRIGWHGLIRYYTKKILIPIADFLPRQARDLIKRLGGVAPNVVKRFQRTTGRSLRNCSR